MLTDLGADVIKVEPPAGDLTRFANPRVNGLATYFVQQNVGKRNISIDLGDPAGVELALRARRALRRARRELPPRRDGPPRPRAGHRRRPQPAARSTRRSAATGPPDRGCTGGPTPRSSAPRPGSPRTQGDARGGDYANDPHSHADVYTSLEADGRRSSPRCTSASGPGAATAVDDLDGRDDAVRQRAPPRPALRRAERPGQWIRSFCPGDYLVFTARRRPASWSSAATRPSGARSSCSCGALELEHLADDPRFADVAGRHGATSTSCASCCSPPAATIPDAATFEEQFAAHRLAVGRAAQRPRARRERVGGGPRGDRRGVRPRRRHDPDPQRAVAVQRRRRRRHAASRSTAARTTAPCSPRSSATTTPPSTPSRPTACCRAGCQHRRVTLSFPVVPMRATLSRCRPTTPAGRSRSSGTATARWPSSSRAAVRLQSSNLYDVTAKYPELAAARTRSSAPSRAVLDGELVVLDDDGRPRFELIQRHRAARPRSTSSTCCRSTTTTRSRLPYEERRRLLGEVARAGRELGVPAHRIGGRAGAARRHRRRGSWRA